MGTLITKGSIGDAFGYHFYAVYLTWIKEEIVVIHA